MKRLFRRQHQLIPLTKNCRGAYIINCLQALIYGSFLTILIQAWQTGDAFFILENFSSDTKEFTRNWATLGYILIVLHFFVLLEYTSKKLWVIESSNPKFDLKRHIDCFKWLGVICGYTAGMLFSFHYVFVETSTADSRLIWSMIALMFVIMIAAGKDFWRLSGLSPRVAQKIEELTERYAVAQQYCRKVLEHRPFVDADFDLLNRELKNCADI